MVQNIAGAILAGGNNKRFRGITKANIIINGKSIISRIIDIIGDIFDEIIIVTNTPEEFNDYSRFILVSDQFLNAGPVGGIHAALKMCSKEALFVFAGDMPLLSKEIIKRQIEFYNNNNSDILTPRINMLIEPLHSIYSKSLIKPIEDFLNGDNDFAVRDFFMRFNVTYLQLPDSEETKNAFTNINSPSDIPIVAKLIGNG